MESPLVDILSDTNILVRRIHRVDPQHRRARDAINRLVSEGHRLCVTSQNLIEFWAVCTRPFSNNGLGLSPEQVDRILARLQEFVIRLADPDDVYPEWRRLVADHSVIGKKTHDARLVACMNMNHITHILTFNGGDFSRFPDITIIEP